MTLHEKLDSLCYCILRSYKEDALGHLLDLFNHICPGGKFLRFKNIQELADCYGNNPTPIVRGINIVADTMIDRLRLPIGVMAEMVTWDERECIRVYTDVLTIMLVFNDDHAVFCSPSIPGHGLVINYCDPEFLEQTCSALRQLLRAANIVGDVDGRKRGPPVDRPVMCDRPAGSDPAQCERVTNGQVAAYGQVGVRAG